MEKSRISRRGMLKGAAAALLALDGSVSAVSSAAAAEQLPLVQNPSLADSGKQKALNSLIISEFRAFLNYCLVYMLEHVFNQFRNCLLCCKSYS